MSAIATILGLLLVVTYIANFLSTELPSTMSTNELNHVLEVENQLGRLQALLQAGSAAHAVGAQFTQPVTLGGVGAPPFAAADSAQIGPETNGSSFSLGYTLVGPGGTLAPFTVTGTAGLTVHLANTYSPADDVSFDQGGVVFAQPGGTPVMIDGPSISAFQATGGPITSVSIWVPQFIGNISTDSGLGTTEISTRLVSLSTLALTASSSLSIKDSSTITFSVTSPYVAAWAGFFNDTSPFGSDWTCTPASVCDGNYRTGGALGTITLSIPTGTHLNVLDIQVATFSVTLI